MSKSELQSEVSQRNMACPQEPSGQVRKMESVAVGDNRAYLHLEYCTTGTVHF